LFEPRAPDRSDRISLSFRCACRATVDRRAALAALAAPLAIVLAPGSARALIPDDDDEELLQKVQAGRRSRMAKEAVIEREFVSSEGFGNARLKGELPPVQAAINNIVKAGAAISAVDAAAAQTALAAFDVSALQAVSTTPESTNAAAMVGAAVGGAQKAIAGGDLAGAKSAYVSVVDATVSWAKLAGVKGSLTSL